MTSLVSQRGRRSESLTVKGVVRVVGACGGQRVQREGGGSRGQMDFTVGVIAS